MVNCPRCGHQNLPSSTSCSKCGTALVAGGAGGGAGDDELARLMANRAAAARRQRAIIGVVAAVAIAAGGVVWYRDWASKQARQNKLSFFERWAENEKRETGAFFNCVMASEIDMNMFSAAEQIQQRVESAYFTQQKTFSDYLLTDCVPKIERARQAFTTLRDPPPEFAAPVGKYNAALAKLQTGIEEYAEKIKGRQTIKDVDTVIQEFGTAWHSNTAPTPEGIAFEKFMHCAVPGLAKMKDAQAMLEFMADACYKKDAVVFMDRVRKECGPLLVATPGAAPSKTWKATMKTIYEQEARQLQAWEGCGRKSRKGKKSEDLSTFLLATGDYMAARAEMAKTAHLIQGTVKK